MKLFNNYPNDEIAEDLQNNGPVYFSMVVFSDFKSYKGGVYMPTTTEQLGTHAVKCIGWGYDEGLDTYYWVCANSWDTQWGEQGFFRIAFNAYIGYKAGSAQNQYYNNESLISS